MTYSWTAFDLAKALSGAVIGFEQTDDYDLSCTGILHLNPRGYHEVTIKGYVLRVEDDGTISSCIPSNQEFEEGTLKIVTAIMGSTGAVGGAITRSSGSSGTGHDDVAILTNIEPRDQFAVQVLNAMLIHVSNPEAFDDAKMLLYSRAAYRWAQAMMIAAADSREGQSTTPSTGVNVNSGDLQSNTEKLLYNIGEYMKNGVTIKGTTAAGTVPVQTEVQNLTDAFSVPEVSGNISISASIFKLKYVRLEVAANMAYSDVSVYLTLTTNDGSRDVGYVIPKGSVVVMIPLDEDVTSITSIDSKTVRGKGGNDPNTYVFA